MATMSKRDNRFQASALQPVAKLAATPPATAKVEPAAEAKQPVRPTCATCRHRWYDLRCHAHPPQLFGQYDNVSAWPRVPDDGGCAEHAKREP